MSIKKYILVLSISFIQVSQILSQHIGNTKQISNDSAECIRKIAIYKEFQRQNMIAETVNAWKEACESCKDTKKIIYQDGVKLVKLAIDREKKALMYGVLIDSLTNMYLKRIKIFGEEGFVSGALGIDLMVHGKEQYLENSHYYLKKSIEIRQEGTDPAVIVAFLNTGIGLFKQEKKSKEDVLGIFLSANQLLQKMATMEKETKKANALNQAIDILEDMYVNSKTADCPTLETLFKEKYITNIENAKELVRIRNLLKKASCYDSGIALQVAKQIDKLQPSVENHYFIAGLLLKNEQYTEALLALTKAVKLELADSLKARFYYEMAVICCYKLQQFEQARDFANQSIKLNPKAGHNYMLIGDCYAQTSLKDGKGKFENSAIIWAAIDKYMKAKTIDPLLVDAANQKIEYYSTLLPSKEEIFFRGLVEGNTYKIEGWIDELTTIRAKK
jgi:tetratricopeptide (TPR) repeat protein